MEKEIFGLQRIRRTKKETARGKSIGEGKCRYDWTHGRETGRQNCEDRAKILTQNSQ